MPQLRGNEPILGLNTRTHPELRGREFDAESNLINLEEAQASKGEHR